MPLLQIPRNDSCHRCYATGGCAVESDEGKGCTACKEKNEKCSFDMTVHEAFMEKRRMLTNVPVRAHCDSKCQSCRRRILAAERKRGPAPVIANAGTIKEESRRGSLDTDTKSAGPQGTYKSEDSDQGGGSSSYYPSTNTGHSSVQ
jgi:hypothetical protein